jgi:hypothetical protein
VNPLARFHSSRPVPPEHRSNFRHLYLDVAWFGIVVASSLSFVGVYSARLGGSALQLGLLSMGPAVANLAFALPAGLWLEKQPIDAAVFWTAAFHRFFYVLWVFLPFFLGAQGQIWALIGLTLVMHIPGTALAVGFNALFAEAVPPDWRGHVAAVRNAVMSLSIIVVSLVCGQILTRVPFPIGYQIVFGLGFLGALMSTVHLWFIVPRPQDQAPAHPRRRLGELRWPRLRRRRAGQVARPRRPLLRVEVLKGSFGRLIAVIAAFHLTLYLAIPLFPLHWVNNVELTDSEIGLGSAVFYFSAFLGATQMARLIRRLGNRRLTAVGAMLMAAYPAFMAVAHGLPLFLAGSAAGGLGWSWMSGSLVNLLLEKVPDGDRPTYLAWYNLSINAALLAGALLGPIIGGWMGLALALGLFAGLRLLAALAIWKWA